MALCRFLHNDCQPADHLEEEEDCPQGDDVRWRKLPADDDQELSGNDLCSRCRVSSPGELLHHEEIPEMKQLVLFFIS